MQPNGTESTIFQVTVEGVMRNYTTNASLYEVAKCSQHAKTLDDLKAALKEQGYDVRFYGSMLHLHLDAPNDQYRPQAKLA